MAVKKKQVEVKEEPKLTTNPDMFTKEDKENMLKLWKVVALSTGQQNQVIDLYRKYVNPKQPISRGCGGCNGGIGRLYDGLRDWYSINNSKFPI